LPEPRLTYFLLSTSDLLEEITTEWILSRTYGAARIAHELRNDMEIPNSREELLQYPELFVGVHLLEMGLREPAHVMLIFPDAKVQDDALPGSHALLLNDRTPLIVLCEFKAIIPWDAVSEIHVDLDDDVWIAPSMQGTDLGHSTALRLNRSLKSSLRI